MLTEKRKAIKKNCPAMRPTPGPAHTATLFTSEGSTLDPVNSERHIPNGKDHSSIQSDLCKSDQLNPAELEGTNSGAMDYSDRVRGIPHPSHFSSISALPSCSPYLPSGDLAIMEEEIQSLLQKQAVCQIPTPTRGFYSNMFIVSKKDGGQRPVINLKHLNRHVKSEHFKMEGLHTVNALLRRNDWMAKVDLKDAFFMVPIGNSPSVLPSSPLQDKEEILPVQLSPIWAVHSPKGIHQAPQAGCRDAQISGHPTGDLHG